MSSPLQLNIENLRELLDAVNALPVGASIPSLTNPDDESKVLSGFDFVDSSGKRKVGTLEAMDTLEAAEEMLFG